MVLLAAFHIHSDYVNTTAQLSILCTYMCAIPIYLQALLTLATMTLMWLAYTTDIV